MKNLGKSEEKKRKQKKNRFKPPFPSFGSVKNKQKKHPENSSTRKFNLVEWMKFEVPKLQRTCPLVVNSLRVEMSARHLGRNPKKKMDEISWCQNPKWKTLAFHWNLEIGFFCFGMLVSVWKSWSKTAAQTNFFGFDYLILPFFQHEGFRVKCFPTSELHPGLLRNSWLPRGPLFGGNDVFTRWKIGDLPKMCRCQAPFVKIFVDDTWCCYRNVWYCWWFGNPKQPPGMYKTRRK